MIYMTDAQNQRAYRYAKDGTFLSTFGRTSSAATTAASW